MGRVINPDSVGKRRKRLVKEIALALREMTAQTDVGASTRDLAAFITLGLQEIADGIDVSVAAWEKRGYWVKADRFRLEWEWAGFRAKDMREALDGEDWATIALTIAKIAQKIGPVKISPRHRMGRPWVGAWRLLQAGESLIY